MKLWGGRFDEGPSEIFERFSGSLHFDRRLFFADIQGSQAWATALARIGIYTNEEAEQVRAALDELAADARGNPQYFQEDDEDVHTLVLRKLGEKPGLDELAQRLHTGRSRNEQVSVDFRLWIRQEITDCVARLDALLDALVSQAERNPALVLPGYTHLRRAQPVLWGHYLLAYFEMFARDRERLQRAADSADALPLGSGALAGSGIPLDRAALARELGFSRLTANSLDATSDRDFALEFLFAAATAFLHLSRLSEDWILYSSEEFGFLNLSDQVTSGSSLMPQKKNPDSLELLRGKTGRMLGHLVALATTIKGTPLSYNRDMQEDKEAVFDAADQLRMGLEMAAVVVATAQPKPEPMELAAAGGWSCATDLAEYLALHGVPFHQAHRIVGTIVRAGLTTNRPPEQWTLEQLREHSPAFGEDCLVWLRGTSGVARREIEGGTGPGVVAQAVSAARQRLQSWQHK
jgi:argininosuccinate lyase